MSGARSSAKKQALRIHLYVAGDSPNSTAAKRHLKAILAAHPDVHATVEVVDVLQTPELGLRDRVLVTPTLIKVAPRPERRIIGSLKDANAVLAVLGLGDS